MKVEGLGADLCEQSVEKRTWQSWTDWKTKALLVEINSHFSIQHWELNGIVGNVGN